ncbi:ABC transporter ATP-binding protein [Microbacterium stercoris]|uniref:ABC transporter ATP-binding protein n=1 Tax=Microbacterium stercoris TaxID=2820289 RepID=A0A939QMZ5_9MICO|nr:ABC transporter ATP-binding protein [Microbacterium stercoris]
MTTSVLEVSDLSKSYRRVSALSDVSFTVQAGECVGLLGPNGAGKTSLLSCLVGARMPSRGRVRVMGADPAEIGAAGHHVAYVFDPPGLSADFTAVDCLRWEAKAQGLPPSVVDEAAERFGIAAYAKRRVGRLSTGQRQRVALAAALIGDPEVLILDEPHNGLDIEAGRWLRDLLDDRTARGRTTILSSHQLDELRRIVERVVVINQTLRYDGPVPARTEESLEAWYLTAIGREAQPR